MRHKTRLFGLAISTLACIAGSGGARGLDNAAVEKLFWATHWTNGVSYSTTLLLKDGMALRDYKGGVSGVEIDAWKGANQRKVGSWTKSGSRYVVTIGTRKPETLDPTRNGMARAMWKGEMLDGYYQTFSTHQTGATPGDSVMYAASRTAIAMRPDGTFGWSRDFYVSTNGGAAGAGGGSAANGRYFVDGHTLILTLHDGRELRRFIALPADASTRKCLVLIDSTAWIIRECE